MFGFDRITHDPNILHLLTPLPPPRRHEEELMTWIARKPWN